MMQGVHVMTIYIVHDNNDIPNNLIKVGEYQAILDTEQKQATSKEDLLVQWGEGPYSMTSSDFCVLNSVEGLKNCTDHNWKQMLPFHGIDVGQESQSYQKKYIVYVINLQVIGLYSERDEVWLSAETKQKGRYREISLFNNRLELRKVKKLAVRSIHSVGLDFGMVVIGVLNNAQFVLKLLPKPILFNKMVQRLNKSIQTLASSLQATINPEHVILGADPEFVLRKSNDHKFVLASKYFDKTGSVGCDQIWLRGDKTKKKLPIVELRPSPSKDPQVLVRNIYMNLLAASKKINDPNIQFLAGSSPLRGYPIGGHIHFSGVGLNSFLLRALDNYLALPLFLLEDPAGFRRRPRYGFVGDFREQYHGGFEYRTLPSWLVSPRITKGVIALAKLISCSYLQLRQVPLSNASVQIAYYQGDQAKMTHIVHDLWEDLEQLPLYSTYQAYLDPLKESILHQNQWNEALDIRPRWRIPPYNKA